MLERPAGIIRQLLSLANIEVNGQHPWDIQVHNDGFYARVLKNPVLGLGETYMQGWWDCARLDEFFYRLLRANLHYQIADNRHFFYYFYKERLKHLLLGLVKYQPKSRAFKIGRWHYDIGNILYQSMLDQHMHYSCGYWRNSTTLAQAQEAKVELICQKLQLQPGMRVLDIGCGWGGFSCYAAKKYGVSVIGITVSQQQYHYAQTACAGLAIEIRLQDYRDVREKFDRICSIGMFEHVGPKNYPTYMRMVSRCLEEGGLCLLHTIGGNISQHQPNPWIHQYIFPDGVIPAIQQIARASEGLLVMEDWHNFGADYDKTLLAWHTNFNQHWDQLRQYYDQRFYRMWNYYLLSCAGAFRARDLQLWQILFSKGGLMGGYQSIR